MGKFTATASREAGVWRLDVAGLGVTRVRALTEAHDAVADLVADQHGTRPSPDDLQVELGGDLGAAVQAARDAVALAELAQVRASAAMRTLVQGLLVAGCSQTEVAVVLDVSKQRVSQLTRAS